MRFHFALSLSVTDVQALIAWSEGKKIEGIFLWGWQTMGEAPAHTRKKHLRNKMATIRDQIQADWENREFVETLTSSIKTLAEFLNNFGTSSF